MKSRWSREDWHVSPSEFISVIYSVQVRIIHLSGTCPARQHIICLIYRWLMMLHYVSAAGHKISSSPPIICIVGHRSSYILLICQLTTLSACWVHPLSLPTSTLLVCCNQRAELLRVLREILLNCPEVTCLFPTSNHLLCSVRAVAIGPMSRRLLWYNSINEINVCSDAPTYQLIVVCVLLRAEVERFWHTHTSSSIPSLVIKL